MVHHQDRCPIKVTIEVSLLLDTIGLSVDYASRQMPLQAASQTVFLLAVNRLPGLEITAKIIAHARRVIGRSFALTLGPFGSIR
jgi:hypothetical protein